MKINYQILCIVLALCIGGLLVTQNSAVDKKDAVLSNIFNRSSVRSYTSEPVSDKDLELLVRAGMAAPTAGNMQPWEFVIINDKNIMADYAKINKYAQMALNSPAAIAVIANLDVYKTKPQMAGYWPQDTSAATQNILLATEALGLGAVWTGVYSENKEMAKDRIEGTQKLLNLQKNQIPLAIIFVGYPDKEPVIKDKWKPEKIFWNKVK